MKYYYFLSDEWREFYYKTSLEGFLSINNSFVIRLCIMSPTEKIFISSSKDLELTKKALDKINTINIY